MQKVIYILFVFMCFVSVSSVYGISDEFRYMINEIGVPEYNVKNAQINEEIYINYNMFVYGGPLSVSSSYQRWKNVSNGKMVRNGVRGEYEVLGQDYSSSLIYNYYFPLDRVTSTPVEKWTFLTLSDALTSWERAYKYYSEEQVEYMKQAAWWFQNIEGGKNDPYDQMQYNLNAIKVGLNKCRLETPATWKTKGSIYTNRRTESGGIGWANFAVEPMAADARVESYIKLDAEEYTLSESDDEIIIPIEFGAELKDLTEYAKAKHVKEFVSKLSVDGSQKAVASGSKITSVGSKFMLVISRNQIPQNTDYKIKIKVQSQVKTEFSADGLLQDTVFIELVVHVKPKKIIPFYETSLKILSKKIDKSQNKWVVSPLAQNIQSTKEGSLGITEAGRYLLLECKLNDNCVKSQIKDINLSIDDCKLSDTGVLENDEEKTLLVYFKVPDNTLTTLYGWKSLREETGSFFKINTGEVLKRKSTPHTLMLKYNIGSAEYEENLLFDTIDDYITNMNNDISSMLSVTKSGNAQVLEGVLCE